MSDLEKKIECAFKNTPRGQIGLREAAAMDALWYEGGLYEDKKRYAQARAADVEEDYKDIPDEVLAAPPVFNFLDDAGFKFVMPAIMRWSLKSTTEDKKEVLAFFAYKLIPESRKADKPDVLAQKWKLSKEQIQVIVEWLEFYTFNYLTYPSELEAAQIERWKKLAE